MGYLGQVNVSMALPNKTGTKEVTEKVTSRRKRVTINYSTKNILLIFIPSSFKRSKISL